VRGIPQIDLLDLGSTMDLMVSPGNCPQDG
jgi:hypothetical protein